MSAPIYDEALLEGCIIIGKEKAEQIKIKCNQVREGRCKQNIFKKSIQLKTKCFFSHYLLSFDISVLSWHNISRVWNYICMQTIMFRALEQIEGRHKTHSPACWNTFKRGEQNVATKIEHIWPGERHSYFILLTTVTTDTVLFSSQYIF